MFFASRPKTLVAGLCPVIVGAAYAFHYTGKVDALYLSILIGASICIQIATNFFNDALDSDKGRDGLERLGPQRAAASGALSSKFLKVSALSLLFLALVLGFVLALKAGFWVFLIGLPALFLAYLYTGSRFSLSTTGMADVFVLIYFGIVPVWATTMILSGHNSIDALLSGLQMGFFANALLLINNLRDYSEDKSNDKKTLVVRFGRPLGLSLLAVCLTGPYVLNLFLNPLFFRSGLWTAPLILFSLFIFYKVSTSKPSAKYNKYLGLTALNLLIFTYFFSTGVISS